MSAESPPSLISPFQFFSLDSVQRHLDQAVQYLQENVGERLEIEIGTSTNEDRPLESRMEAIFQIWWAALTLLDGRGSSQTLDLDPQVEIRTPHQTYRVDFAVVPRDKDQFAEAVHYGFEWPRLGVELDGHDFHERTVEQVTLRNQRDRDLQQAGWRIFHFSGTEIHRNPEGCVHQVLEVANAGILWLQLTLRNRQRQRDIGLL